MDGEWSRDCEWRDIEDIPGYGVSEFGDVISDQTGRKMLPSLNQQGNPHVGLLLDGKQVRRSLALLVAKAFLQPPKYDHFNTPIHINGDKTDCRATNLAWRPRWYAVAYHKQFDPNFDVYLWVGNWSPVRNADTKEEFTDAAHAALSNGLLIKDVYLSILNNTTTTATFQKFEFIEEP